MMGPVVEDVIGHCRASCCSLSKVESTGRFLVKGGGNRCESGQISGMY